LQYNYFYYCLVLIAQRKISVLATPVMSSKLRYWRSSTFFRAPVVYGYGNFAIGLDPKFFHKLHIQSVSENLKLWAPISNPNPKPTTQLHISKNIW